MSEDQLVISSTTLKTKWWSQEPDAGVDLEMINKVYVVVITGPNHEQELTVEQLGFFLEATFTSDLLHVSQRFNLSQSELSVFSVISLSCCVAIYKVQFFGHLDHVWYATVGSFSSYMIYSDLREAAKSLILHTLEERGINN